MIKEVEIENLASLMQETHRRPDPYSYLVNNGKLRTSQGDVVENYVLNTTTTEQAEWQALQTIQNWALTNKSGCAIWFSPPLADTPTSKITISERRDDILFNRAVVLDTNANELLELANKVSANIRLENAEELRKNPFFPTEAEYAVWFKHLAKETNQVEMILNGQDVITKKESLTRAKDLMESVPVYNLTRTALNLGLLGRYQDSCNYLKPQSAFELVFNTSLKLNAEKTLECNCPFCTKRVSAKIKEGRIHCPECGQSAPYKC